MSARKLTFLSILLGSAMIIFILEAQIPPIAPIPGIKLGLANVINLIALYMFGRRESFAILALRVLLSSIFVGNFSVFMYSFAGGMVCFLFMSTAKLFIPEKRMWVTSILGAVGHNIGQIMTAVFITRTAQVAWYLPVLTVSAVITGAFTGVIAQLTLNRLRKAGGGKA